MAKGCKATTTIRKMIVNFTSSSESAISLGVFWRSAPSTSRIILSMNPSPGSAVIDTLIQSDRTLVPPVTAERSPPDSRITGADSPVIADSSTEAIPSTISPSPGISSPADTITRSPARRSDAGTVSSLPSGVSRRAIRSARVRRSVSACALPRPSAIASAKFANKTVNHRPSPIAVSNATGPPLTASAMIRIVTTTDTTSTTKITGLRSSVRGLSFQKLSTIACRTMGPSKSGRALTAVEVAGSVCGGAATAISAQPLLQLLDDRPEGERREERQRADDHDHPGQEAGEQAGVRPQRSCRERHGALLAHARSKRKRGDQRHEAGDEHRDAAGDRVVRRAGGEPRERRPVVVPLREVRVEDLAEPVGTGVQRPREARRRHHRDRGERERHEERDEHRDHDDLDLARGDLLAEVLRRASDHQTADEYGDHDVEDHSVEPAADAAEDHLADRDVEHRREAAERLV